ncbi:hypothetical protein ACK25U_11805 [Ectopseudomonas mendocina]
MDTVIEFFTTTSLSDWGSWASILGIGVSLVTLVVALRLKRQFMFRSRVDEHLTALDEIASNISSLLISYESNHEDIDRQFAVAFVRLRYIKKDASSDLRSDVSRAKRRIALFRFRYRVGFRWVKPNQRHARSINTDINIVVEELDNVKKELIVGG